jgi:hypothetical protein
MKNFTLLFILGMLSFSCGKKEELSPESDIKVEIVQALNSGNSDLAEELALRGKSEAPHDVEFDYYLGQAYSQKADIDIYTLFPLVQMQIFDVAISEWQQAREYEKRHQDSISLGLLGSKEEREQMGTQEGYEYRIGLVKTTELKDLKINKEIVEKGVCEDYSWTEDGEKKAGGYIYCNLKLKLSSSNIGFEGIEHETYMTHLLLPGEEFNEEEFEKEELSDWHKSQFVYFVMGILEKKIETIKRNKVMEKYLKGTYAIFDSMPILKAVPMIQNENMEYLFKSIEILKTLLATDGTPDRVRSNSIKHLGLLGGYLIAYSMKLSIDFDSVQEPKDLLCKINSDKVLESYEYFLTGVATVLDVTIYTKYYEKNKESLEKAKELLKTLPRELTDEEKAEYSENIRNIQTDNC